jgi:ubiquinone/menaquinone biosynthesis C-methylase UbiE
MAAAFDTVAAEYERGRPGYPADALDALARELGLAPDSVVVDLAAGTGKLTRSLAGRFARVIAVEPLAEMRDQLQRALPEVETMEGTAERMPLQDALADAVFVGQAFHWFDGPRALAEIARVLKPAGGLALLWNTTPWEEREGPWFAALDDLLEQSRVDLSTMRRHASGGWASAFREGELFGTLSEATFENEQRQSRSDFMAALASRSYIAALGEAGRREVMEGVERLLDRPDAPTEDDEVLVPMRTAAYWARRS